MSELARKRIMVAIETDATRYHGEHARRPRLLSRSEAEQMLAHLSTDLSEQFPQIRSCSLAMAGALFDQTQLLRPGYPVYASLESLSATGSGGSAFQAGLISFGADSGQMPNSDLQPSDAIPLGLLQTLPLLLFGEKGLVETLSDQMEHKFLDSGQLSAHAAKAVEANFSVAVNHARFMTLTDLNAMLHLQLEHFGFLPLWQLLDAAINTPDESLSVTGTGGQEFRWTGNAVRCSFETFDYWSTRGAGKARAADGQLLAQGYSDWTREYRQYLTTLAAHDVNLEQVLADEPGQVLKGNFQVETSAYQLRREAAQVTEHSSGDLGTVAVTVVGENGQLNYYPLAPSGLNDLHASIRKTLGATDGVSFPGSILYDHRSRQLQPDALPSGGKT